MAKNITASKFLLPYADKNGRHQVGIRLRVVEPKIQTDFTVKYPNGEYLKLTKIQYKNLTNDNYNLILNTKLLIVNAVTDLINNDFELRKETIAGRMIQIQQKKFVNKISDYLGYDLLSDDEMDELNDILKEIEIDDNTQLEDLAAIFADKKIALDKAKREKEILQSYRITNALERTKKQYELLNHWDKNNLILQIGKLFTLEKDNGKPLIHTLNRGLLNNLYDYIVNKNAPNNINVFDEKYCKNFIRYLINDGVIKASLGKTPMELVSGNYDSFFKERKHEIISYSTFIDKIKALNSFILNLKEQGINIPVRKKFRASDFIDTNSVITEKGSNKDHHLKPGEVKTLLNKNFKNKELELAKDTFLILVFCGGLRGIKNFDVEIDRTNALLDVYHSKVNKRIKIPIFDELDGILAKYNDTFPDFTDEEKLTFNLRAVARELKWTRIIKTANTRVTKKKSDAYYIKNKLSDIIDLTFARKTFVNYARIVYNIPDGEIIQYTGHASVDLLKYYMGDFSIDEMKRRLNK